MRSLSPGTTFRLTQGPLDVLDPLDTLNDPNDPEPRFLTTRAVHAGINNLPKHISAQVAQRVLDGTFEHSGAGLLAEWVDAEVRTQAARTGYANAFEAIRASVPWRPALSNDAGQPLHPKPVIGGPLLATVVDAEGATSSPAEIHTDRKRLAAAP